MERGNGMALWRQIQELLKSDILSHKFPPGSMLPTEKELAAQFDVNRHTIRRAIAELSGLGLVITRQGSGSFVPEALIDYTVQKRTRFSETISAQSRVPTVTVIHSKIIPATRSAARALGVRKGIKIMCIRTLGEADGRPLSLADHHFASGRFPGLADVVRRTGSLSDALNELGVHDFTRQTTRVTAQIPDKEEARLLQQPVQRPVLLAISLNVTQDGKPLEYGRTLFAGDRVQMVFEP